MHLHIFQLFAISCVGLIGATLIKIFEANQFSEKQDPTKNDAQLNRMLQDDDEGEYIINWGITLEGEEFVLASLFLTAGFEITIKEQINKDLFCDESLGLEERTSFHGVTLEETEVTNKLLRVSGYGKCKGKKNRCKRTKKYSTSDAGRKSSRSINPGKTIISKHNVVDCSKSIFVSFQGILETASSFNYHVELQVIEEDRFDTETELTIEFTEENGIGLSSIDDIEFTVNSDEEISSSCSIECENQKSVMRDIFRHFEIPIEDDQHECFYEGINCNTDGFVTTIWFVNRGFKDKSIPGNFDELKHLYGLFLGENGLVGTIPISLGLTRNLRLLWLQDNALTGQIPTQLANKRNLVEINLRGNQLTGSIPTGFFGLTGLSLLNLGRNNLNGRIMDHVSTDTPTFTPTITPTVSVNEPAESFQPTPSVTPDDDCFQCFCPIRRLIRLIWCIISFIFRLFRSQIEKKKITFQMNTNLKTIALYENNLSGEIPSELSIFSNLIHLSLAKNNIKGKLPSELGELGRLKILDVRDNSMSGIIPIEIGDIHDLRYLHLYNNSFTGTIPTELGKLEDLEELILDLNVLTGPIPSELGNCTKLTSLTFSGNKLSGEIPSELGNLTEVENLDIRDYAVNVPRKSSKKNALPSELGKLSSWRYVVFRNNGLTGTVPSEFGNLQSAEALWFNDQSLSGTIPSTISNLTSLSVLGLGNNVFEGEIPEEIANLDNLVHLFLGGNELTGTIPSAIAEMESLQVLDLGDNKFSGTIPSELGLATSIEILDLGYNLLTGVIPSELEDLSSLDSLIIGGNDITGDFWFMCRLQSFELPDIEALNCSDYCGTEDEECNSTSLHGAECIEVGCGNSNTPICTDLCRLDYSSCFAGLGEISFELNLKTDHKGYESAWTIQDVSGTVAWQSERTYWNNAEYLEYRCLAEGCYSFELSDTEGDGICCGDIETENGRYAISNADSSFNFSTKYVFGNDCQNFPMDSTLHPTPSMPTDKPTYNPTFSPTKPFRNLTLVVPANEVSDGFGSSVSISGNRMIIGTAGSTSRSVFIFSKDGSYLGVVHAAVEEFTESFGRTISMYGDTMLISALLVTNQTDVLQDADGLHAGVVYIFTITRSFVTIVKPSESKAGDEFGASLAIHGSTFVVGAPNGDNDDSEATGSAYIYLINGTSVAKLLATDGRIGDSFGYSVGISRDMVVVGSPLGRTRNGRDSGSVYLFSVDGTFMKKIVAPDGLALDRFGISISLSNEMLVVGAVRSDGSGSVYMFTPDGIYIDKLVSPEGSVTNKFGISIDNSGDIIVVGAESDGDDGEDSGAAYIYSSEGIFQYKMFAHNRTSTRNFGRSVSISNNLVVIGAPGDGSNVTGQAYLYL